MWDSSPTVGKAGTHESHSYAVSDPFVPDVEAECVHTSGSPGQCKTRYLSTGAWLFVDNCGR